MALNDIGPGDGAPVLIPGSHKCSEIHPRLKHDGKGIVYDGYTGKPAGSAFATQEVHLKAGDVVMFHRMPLRTGQRNAQILDIAGQSSIAIHRSMSENVLTIRIQMRC